MPAERDPVRDKTVEIGRSDLRMPENPKRIAPPLVNDEQQNTPGRISLHSWPSQR
jgi:hypothetical protein